MHMPKYILLPYKAAVFITLKWDNSLGMNNLFLIIISYSKTLYMQSCMNVRTLYTSYHYMKRYIIVLFSN